MATEAQWCPPAPQAPPPQDRRQMPWCIRGSLAHWRWRPILMTGVLRQLLLHHFADPRNIEDPALKDGAYAAIWQDGPSTGIMIESVHRWRGDLADKRPAILVKRNAYRNLRVTIQDRQAVDGRGFEHYMTLWVGSHTVFCVHGTGAQCEILATEVQRELTQFGPAIGQQLGLHKFQVTEVGAVSEEATTGWYVVPVTVGWAYQETWRLDPDSLPLKGVALTVNVTDV